MTKAAKLKSLFSLFIDNEAPVLPHAEAVNEKDELYALCDDPMTSPVKLINQQLAFTDAPGVRDCFVENSGFLVVGVVGLQGVGKSSILNLLANRLGSRKKPFTGPFPVESADSVTNNHPQTTGVDMYITQDRVILLDTQPLLSWALTDAYAQTSNENYGGGNSNKLNEVLGGGGSIGEHRSASSKRVGNPSHWSLDFYAECSSIQIIAFLFSVCHVVVSVTDNLSAPDHLLLRLFDKAASLKPLIHVEDLLLAPQITGPPPTTPQQPPAAASTAKVASAVAGKGDEGAIEKIFAVGGVPDSEETCLGQTSSSAIRLRQQLPNQCPRPPQSRAAQQAAEQAPEVAEQAEVRAIVNRLQKLADYSASLIHVYNLAPSAVFLNPATRARLSEYRDLLRRSFPQRCQFASLARLGPRILRRHMASRRRRPAVEESTSATTAVSAGPQPPVVLDDQKEEELEAEEERGSMIRAMAKLDLEQDVSPLNSNSPSSVSGTSPKNQLSSDHSLTMPPASLSSPAPRDVTTSEFKSRGESGNAGVPVTSRVPVISPPAATDSSMRITEEEIVADCCDLLSDLTETENDGEELDIDDLKQYPNQPPVFGHPSTIEWFFEEELASVASEEGDGEHRAVELSRLTRKVAKLRRNFFDLTRQVKRPRLFLLPATDEEGRVTFGCPEYQQGAYKLQEAILSTPRQHMMPNLTELHWFEYAQKTWATISTSPLLFDYHNLLLTNTT